MDLLTALSAHSTQVYTTIEQFFSVQEAEARQIDSHLSHSLELLREFTLRGGKAIRPFLAQLAYDYAHGQAHAGLPAALASIELHHKHLLILDDIADRDERRYGGPTLEHVYRAELEHFPDGAHRALSFAMMDGVLLGAYSKEILMQSGFPPARLLAVIHILDQTMYRDTLAGWQIHGMQALEPLAQATQADFIKGLKYVTASYTFEGPLMIGLTLAGNRDSQLEAALRTYADAVGTAFQMHDDILGLFGKPDLTGKPVGNDVREGKKTLLLQEAYARGSSGERAILDAACGQAISSDMLQQVQQVVKDTGSLAHAQELEQQYVARGIAALDPLPATAAKEQLLALAHYIISREK